MRKRQRSAKAKRDVDTSSAMKLRLRIAGLAAAGLLVLLVAYFTVAPLLQQGGDGLAIVYPFDGSLFPPEIIAPRIWWDDTNASADKWRVTVRFTDGSDPISVKVDNREWTPDPNTWETIKRRSLERPATITVQRLATMLGVSRALSSDHVSIATSPDSVGAPIFYRDVPLPFSFALRNVPMIRWRLGDVSSYEPPPVVLTNLPVCGNCHSFSSDGKYLGMDVDVGNDKGAYVLTSFEEQTAITRDKLISWTDYIPGMKVPTFGMLARVSPDGRYVLAGVKDRVVFLPREDILFSQIFFPVMGILAYYDRETGGIAALPGADDEDYVQANAAWSPDGEYVYFARNRAVRLETKNPIYDILLSLEECAEVLGGEEFLWKAQEGGKKFRFDLYRIPFNGGQGGVPEPVAGASQNGMSNYFPKISPDGKWLVFTQAHSFMLLQPDSRLYIMPAQGGEPRPLNANTSRMNSWHSWSPNSRWLVFSSKLFGPHTQLFLTHIDEDGNDTPPVLLRNFTAADRAANIPEFVNIPVGAQRSIQEKFVDDYNYYRSGRIHQQFREYDRAEEDLLKSLQMNPRNTGALYSLASIYAQRGDLEEASETFERLARMDPNDPVVRKELGGVHFQLENYDRAEAEFRSALRLDPDYVAARYNLGTVHLLKSELDEAERQFQRLLELDIDISTARNVHERLAAIYMRRQEYRATIEHLEMLVALDSANYDARYNLGLSYRAVDELDKALQVFETLVHLTPEDVQTRNQLGDIYAASRMYVAAMEQFQKTLELEPNNLYALMQLGRLYYETRDFEKAERSLLQVVTLDPSNVFAHVNLGRVYHEAGRYGEAADQFTSVVRLNPNSANAWFMLGEALTRKGESIPQAITAFSRGLSLDPNYVDAHVTLGELYVRTGDLGRALQEYELALQLNPQDPKLANDLRSRIIDLRRRGATEQN